MLTTLCLAALLAAATSDAAPHATASRVEVRGMTVSCPGAGRIWGTDAMVETMAELKSLGVNWITIHPYAGIRPDGTVVAHDRWYGDARWLTRPIAEAHRLGLRIMIKPHLAYWGSPFSWRGEIEFHTDEQWERFFDTYRAWVLRVADLCADADAFVVGTELDRTVHHEQAWREIIASLRARLDVPLTYSSNWDAFERVPFWDALDVIGIQSYFPLVDHDRLPEPEELRRGWSRLLRRLEGFAAPYGKKVLLAELGYNRSSLAASRPWEYRQGGPDAEETQRRCLAAALDALEDTEVVVGAFLWKWFPGTPRRGNFLKSTPAMREVIAERWRRGAGADSPTGP